MIMPTPERLVIDPDPEKQTRGLFYTAELEAALPELPAAFQAADERYQANPDVYLRDLAENTYSFKSEAGGRVDCSLLYREEDTLKTDELLVVWAPFSDVRPNSSPEVMATYRTLATASLKDKQAAQPNSWNQVTKSSVYYEVLSALETGMPVLTIFSPLSQRAYNHDQRNSVKNGDFSPAGSIVEQAIQEAQARLHGPKSETQIMGVHLHGASLGASKAIGSAQYLERNGNYQPQSVTAQELILGPTGLPDLLARFKFKAVVGEPSDTEVGGVPLIREPLIRRELDAHGLELQVINRMVKGATKLTDMRGLTHHGPTVQNIDFLVREGIPVTVALAQNSGLTNESFKLLPHQRGLHTIDIFAKKGEKVDHLADEQVALCAAVLALGIRRTKEQEND